MSEGGKSITAFASRTNKGKNKIVAQLNPGAGVVTPRADAHWIVTEYGAVDLYGKSLQERARLMISIAHPDFRRRLYEEYLEYQRSCGMEEGLQEYMERHQYSRDWAIL
jgi:acyl-CoA hydrolase